MTKHFSLLLFCIATTLFCSAADKMIRISTDNTDLIFHLVSNNRIYQPYFGQRLSDPSTLSY
ncbi:MAG: hypothetical protein ACI4TS_06130, partial [Bacteroidaceae bacterium]